jgi:hypothetical protein
VLDCDLLLKKKIDKDSGEAAAGAGAGAGSGAGAGAGGGSDGHVEAYVTISDTSGDAWPAGSGAAGTVEELTGFGMLAGRVYDSSKDEGLVNCDEEGGGGVGHAQGGTEDVVRRGSVKQIREEGAMWPSHARELVRGVNDTWNSFQCANKGRSVTTAEWKSAQLLLWEEHAKAEAVGEGLGDDIGDLLDTLDQQEPRKKARSEKERPVTHSRQQGRHKGTSHKKTKKTAAVHRPRASAGSSLDQFVVFNLQDDP